MTIAIRELRPPAGAFPDAEDRVASWLSYYGELLEYKSSLEDRFLKLVFQQVAAAGLGVAFLLAVHKLLLPPYYGLPIALVISLGVLVYHLLAARYFLQTREADKLMAEIEKHFLGLEEYGIKTRLCRTPELSIFTPPNSLRWARLYTTLLILSLLASALLIHP